MVLLGEEIELKFLSEVRYIDKNPASCPHEGECVRHMWRVVFIALLTAFATTSTILFPDDVRAGSPVTGDIVVDTVWSAAGSPYWIETDVTVLAGVDLTVLAGTEVRFNGYYSLNVNGRLLVQGDSLSPAIFTYNGSTPSPADWAGIQVFGKAHIDFANISYAYVGVHVASSTNTINDSFFYRNEDGIGLAAGIDNVIRDNTLHNSTYCGIVVWQSTSNELIGNNATRNGDTGIWLYETSGNLVLQNKLYRNYWNGIRVSGGSTSNVIVENTVLESQLYQGIGVWDSSDNSILNNTIRRNNNGVYLGQSSGNNVSGNEITDSVNYHGISLYRADSNVMMGNHIYNVWQDGLYMETSSGNRIYENIIHDNENGIYMYDCWMNEISKNNITGNSDGIYTHRSMMTEIILNNISENSMGIRLYNNSNDAIVVGNILTLNLWSGITTWLSDQIVMSSNEISKHLNGGVTLLNSSNVTISENNLTGNGLYGVDIWTSRDVSVYNNNFIGHVDHAIDDGGSENRWDDGYPSGGNYWDDYMGNDYFSGPSQDQPGSDYIGDEPYVIDSDSQDNYPLAHPFGLFPSLGPTSLDSHLSGEEYENVTITWVLSEDDSAGKGNVVKYSIYRGKACDPSGSGYGLLVNVSNGTSTYTDSFVGEGDSDNYFYRVCAINSWGIPSCTANQAGKFAGPLPQGLNLVSIPLSQSNESIETVLQTVKYNEAWFYDPFSQEWKWYMKSKAYRRGLWNINHTMGVWVNVTEDSNLTVAGIVPALTEIQLYKGWNLVSFPSYNSSYTVYDLKIVGVVRVEGYDPVPPYHLRMLGDTDVLQGGYGYWVRVEADVVWAVDID